MNNKIEEDDLFTNVEPVISYYSSSSNLGVTAIYSNQEIKPYNKKYNSLFTPYSPKNNFSLCNTVMIPSIINKNEIEYDNNYYNNNMNQSISISKEKDNRKNSIKIDNTRNKTISSKGENKENDDSFDEKINIQKENNIILEKNPFFLGKNLNENYTIDVKFKNDGTVVNNNNKNINDNDNNSKNEDDFIKRDACKSVNINDSSTKNSFLRESYKKEKSDLIIKKNKKIKLKDKLLSRKSKKKINIIKEKDKDINNNGKDNINKKFCKKSSFFRGQSRSFIEEAKKENNNKMDKMIISTNLSGEKRCRSYYYSNKMVNKNYNENYFKSIIKKNNYDKIEEEKENEKNQIEKKEKKKLKKKSTSKTPLKDNNISKFLKTKISKEYNSKILKHQSHSRQGINMLKDHIKNKDKEDSSYEHSVNLGKENYINLKEKRLRKLKSSTKERKESDSEEKMKEKIRTPDRRKSRFSFKKKSNRKNSEKDDNSDQKTFKNYKMKKDKDKENNSKSYFSLKERESMIAKNKLNKSISRKDISSLKNSYDDKENVNKCLNTVLKRKRSISVNLDKSILKEVAQSEKDKKEKKSTENKINCMSTTNLNKSRRLTRKNFDFESALKKNSKKIQFNLFSKDKFTNTEINNSDYLKYTLNCMELIIEIDMEKQIRLKNKINFNFPKPKKKNAIKKRIALFDLDETLVHCTGDIKLKKEKYQHAIEIKLPGKQAVQVGINLRPYWKQTLNLIKKHYHIVIYTASHQAYADSVLDFMDPKKKYFKYRLYRNNCSLIDVEGAKFYVKDLDILNEYYDLKDIVIIDNSVLSFAFHLHNGIPIVPYYDEDKDGSLYVVGLYLLHIFPENDLREANKTQINLDSFLEEAKKQKEEEDIIDEESGDDEKEKEENTPNNSKKDIEIKNGSDNNDNKSNKEKKVAFTCKKKIFNEYSPNNHKRQSQDIAQKNLISQSKLINMYYEVNDESSKSLQNLQKEIKENNLKRMKTISTVKNVNEEDENSDNNNDNNNDKNPNVVVIQNDDIEMDCKSDPGMLLFEGNNNISDNDSSDDNIPVLKRGFTIIHDNPHDNKKEKSIKGKLKFIRSNFFNNFKI